MSDDTAADQEGYYSLPELDEAQTKYLAQVLQCLLNFKLFNEFVEQNYIIEVAKDDEKKAVSLRVREKEGSKLPPLSSAQVSKLNDILKIYGVMGKRNESLTQEINKILQETSLVVI